jgi:phosphoesterase RecJ-like protein
VQLTLEMFERAGAEPGDSEGLIDHPRSISGVEAAALFKQLPDGRWKTSLRSRGPVDVERVARSHGGGGHKNAAGCVLTGDLPAVKAAVVGLLTRAVEEAHA